VSPRQRYYSGCLIYLPKDEAKNGAFLFRLGVFWSPLKDVWWNVSDQPGLGDPAAIDDLLSGDFSFDREASESNIDFVTERVDDAIGRISEYGIPYFLETEARLSSD
jgi:hypothetical protein